MHNSGIYQWKNIETDLVYIGSAKNFTKRKGEHSRLLCLNKHPNRYLQFAWNKYGKDSFAFEVIEHVDDVTRLIEREQIWIDFFGAFAPKGYNMLPKAGSSLGFKHSKEAREKISKLKSNVKYSEETRKKISVAMAGRKFTDEWRAKMTATKLGHSVSEETRAKLRLAAALQMKNNPPSEEARLKMSAASNKRWAAVRAAKEAIVNG